MINLGLIGAILGDIAGSLSEFQPIDQQRKTKHFYCERAVFTDDTIQSIAVKMAIMQKRPYKDVLLEMGKKYLFVGYGGLFHKFLKDPDHARTDSYGDGAVMRVSYIGTCFDTLEETVAEAERSAYCTHNSEEAIRGVRTVTGCIFLAEHGKSKEEILQYAASRYPIDQYQYSVERPLAEYQQGYSFEVRCDNTVPVAIRCFYESNDYFSFLQKVHFIGGDTDSLGAIGGGIAESYYHGTGLDEKKLLQQYLDDTLYEWVMK